MYVNSVNSENVTSVKKDVTQESAKNMQIKTVKMLQRTIMKICLNLKKYHRLLMYQKCITR